MGVNATLLGQMITFCVLVFFTAKFVWPPMMAALSERQQKIADGIAAGERGQRELELAQHKATDVLRDAKLEATKIIELADKRATGIVEDSKGQARIEAEKMLQVARGEIDQERKSAREALSREIAGIALASAEKLIGHKIDASANNDMLNELIAEVSGE